MLGIATFVAARSDCTRSKVGAVITDARNRIVSTGYIGTVPGESGCLEGACPRGQLSEEECPPGSDYSNCISFHAEVNALLYSDRSRHEGGTIYVNRMACPWCWKLIRASGLHFAVFGIPGRYVWVDVRTEEAITHE
jgi:dCMP deaminase